MRTLFTAAMAAGLLLAGGVAAQAPTPALGTNDSDLKCLLVAVAALESGRAEAQQPGLLAATYYLGRLDGRSPGLDLRSAVSAQQAKLKPGDISTEAARCGAEMQAGGQALRSLGQPATPPPTKAPGKP